MSSVSTCSSTSPVGMVRIDGLVASRHERALRPQHELVPDLVRELGRLGCELRIDHELRDPGAVAEIDEDETAVITAARRPAGEGQLLADELLVGLAAHVSAPGHRTSLPRRSA